MDGILRSDGVILIEAPRGDDAEFYGRWLLAAAEAEELWNQAFADLTFRERVERLLIMYVPDFGAAAVRLITQLDQTRSTVAVDLDSEDGDEFTMLLGMGFFVLTGERYQMCIPPRLTLANVKAALIAYAETEDQNYFLHPEYL